MCMFVCVLGRERGFWVYTTFPPPFYFVVCLKKRETDLLIHYLTHSANG